MSVKFIILGSGRPRRVKDFIDVVNFKIGNGKPIYGKIPFRKDEQKFSPSIEKIKKRL